MSTQKQHSVIQDESDPIEKQAYYISAKLADSNKIKSIRDTLYSDFVASKHYTKSDPHITVYPKFKISKQKVDPLQSHINTLSLEGVNVRVNGVGVWPSINNPRVVLLDVEVPLTIERSQLNQFLQYVNANQILNPVPAHITLFQKSTVEPLSMHSKEQLQQMISANRNSWNTSIKYVDLEHIPSE